MVDVSSNNNNKLSKVLEICEIVIRYLMHHDHFIPHGNQYFVRYNDFSSFVHTFCSPCLIMWV